MEHSTSVWLGQLRVGGHQDLLRTQLVQPRPWEHVLHHHILHLLLCFTFLYHHGVLLAAPEVPPSGEHCKMHSVVKSWPLLVTALHWSCSACSLVSQVAKLKVSEGGSTNRIEVQVARMVVAMVLAFLLTWLPYAAMAIAVIIDSSLYIDPFIATIPVYLAKSSNIYNPIIYILMNRQVTLHHTHLYSHRHTPRKERNSDLNNHTVNLLTTFVVCVYPVPRICCSDCLVWPEPMGLGSTNFGRWDYTCFSQQEP